MGGGITDSWAGVLHPRENNVMSTWEGGLNGGLKEEYLNDIHVRNNLNEHLDMALQGDLAGIMEWDDIEEQEVVDSINNW